MLSPLWPVSQLESRTVHDGFGELMLFSEHFQLMTF